MSDPAYSAASERAGQMYAVVKSIRQFDKLKVAGIVSAIMKPTERECCFMSTYYRAAGNVESLLTLDSPRHFQAAAMLARSLFELAVDVKLVDKVPAGWAKMWFFVDVEKLRSAQRMIDFRKAHPDRDVDVSSQTEFVAKNEALIEHNRKILWPPKKPTTKPPDHWSSMNLSQRTKLLGDPFDEMYNFQYPRLSWYVHSGLTGVFNMPSEFFPMVHGYALSLSISCYSTILESVVHEMKIDLADEKIYDHLKYAKLLPFTNSQQEEEKLFRALLD